jgi:hypothetical protein
VVADREVSWMDMVRAGTVIFGPGFAAKAHRADWRAGLRAAWRRRVLETHPDRAAVLGRSEAGLQQEFRAVTEAFALLEAIVTSPSRPTRAPPPRGSPPRRPPSRPPRAPPPPTAQSAKGSGPRLPRRRLRFAEFLYYSGRVDWQSYVAAVAWQRGQRPPIGRLAVELGLLGQRDVMELLELRRREGAQTEPLGEFAVRRGLLTRAQLLGLVGRQNRGQPRIGQFFLERALLAPEQLEGAQLALFGHNARYAA